MAKSSGVNLNVYHVPKTIDNDLRTTDHCPGYGSAGRFVALAHMGDDADNRSLKGIKINIIMGRDAGWLTAASVLARTDDAAEMLGHAKCGNHHSHDVAGQAQIVVIHQDGCGGGLTCSRRSCGLGSKIARYRLGQMYSYIVSLSRVVRGTVTNACQTRLLALAALAASNDGVS